VGDRGSRGPPYHVVANLIAFAATNWDELNGILLMRGVRLMALPLHEACDVLFATALEGRDEQGRAKMLADLDQPTPAQAERARNDIWYGAERDAEMFAAAERSFGGMFG
jgi:hypothetical protein